jgi:integrase
MVYRITDRLELHRLHSGNPQSGPIFANARGNALCLGNVVNRVILPALNRCAVCLKPEANHRRADHDYARDSSIPEWHGWHAAGHGLGSNLNRLGVDDSVIQRILRHASISTTQAYYIKTSPDDVRSAMAKLEHKIGGHSTMDVAEAERSHASTTIQ